MFYRALLALALTTAVWVEPIHFLVIKSDCEAVKAQLARGASIDEKDHNGETPLHWAVRQNRPEMVRFLLAEGAAPDLPDPNGHAPLYHASSLELAAPLLERGANPARLDYSGSTPLHQMCLYNKHQVVALMLKRGALVNHASKYGTTPLLEACHFGAVESLDLLLAHGARVDVVDQDGLTPLLIAARSGSRATVERLVRAGVAPSDPKAFELAVGAKKADLVEYLGARVRVTPEVLVSAISWGQLPLFQALLARGGKPDPSLVRSAAHSGQVEVLTWLLDQGLSVESPDQEKSTALMLAAAAYQAEVIQLLLARGADPQRQDAAGRRPADYLRAAILFQEDYIDRKSRSRARFVDAEEAQARLLAMRKALEAIFARSEPP